MAMGARSQVIRQPRISVAVALIVFGQTDEVIREIIEQIEGLNWKPLPLYLVINEVGRALDIESQAITLEPTQNLGFCGGANLAAQRAMRDGHTHLLILNLDIKILDTDLVSRLFGVFEFHEDCAFVSPGISYWPQVDRIWYRGGQIIRPVWVARHPNIGKSWFNVTQDAMKTDYFSGCCVLADLEIMMGSEGFDEGLFMYYDEADLATRVTQRTGKFSYMLDVPLIAHAKVGRNFNRNEAFFHARNSRTLLDRNEKGVKHAVGVIGQLIIVPFQLLRCESREARKAYVRGYFEKSSTAKDH
jgi:GT2 family glycosyltransferase